MSALNERLADLAEKAESDPRASYGFEQTIWREALARIKFLESRVAELNDLITEVPQLQRKLAAAEARGEK